MANKNINTIARALYRYRRKNGEVGYETLPFGAAGRVRRHAQTRITLHYEVRPVWIILHYPGCLRGETDREEFAKKRKGENRNEENGNEV